MAQRPALLKKPPNHRSKLRASYSRNLQHLSRHLRPTAPPAKDSPTVSTHQQRPSGSKSQGSVGGSLCTAPEGGLPAFHGNISSGSVPVLTIKALLVYRFAWLGKWPWCSANIESGCGKGDGAGFPRPCCVLIPSHRPAPSIAVDRLWSPIRPHKPVNYFLVIDGGLNQP